jgi:predicted pyridoxine 5'-phosphate oxidase superfamily flavin-nucleotide-binding protein
MIPGKKETLRIKGKAVIVRDQWLLEQLAYNGKLPNFAIVVTIEAVLFHCAKCIIRAKMWDVEHWQELDGLASLAQVVSDHANLKIDIVEFEKEIEQENTHYLY